MGNTGDFGDTAGLFKQPALWSPTSNSVYGGINSLVGEAAYGQGLTTDGALSRDLVGKEARPAG